MAHDGRKRTLEAYKRREMLVDALNTSFDIFTSHLEEEFDKVLADGLRPLAEAIGVDRIVINRLIEIDGKKRLRQLYRWDLAEGGLTDRSINILPNNQAVSKWIKILMRDVPVNKQVRDMSENENAFLSIYGIKSILMIPIFTRDKFWGVVVFQDHKNERYFDDDCMDLFRSAARICTTAIMREHIRRRAEESLDALSRSKKTADTLNKMAVIFLSPGENTFEDMMTAGMNLLVAMVHIDKISVWKNFRQPDGLHASQMYSWDKETGGAMVSMTGHEDITYDQYMPRWDESFEAGISINSPVSLLPEVAVLQSLNALSVFAAPVFFDHVLWGFVIFEDRHTGRYFDNESAEMMRSAAFLCANAVMRAEMANEIAEKNELNRVMFNAAPVGLTLFDDNFNFVDCNDTALAIYGVTKEYYLNNFYELSPEYQPDGSKSLDKVFELMKAALNGEKVRTEWMHCSTSGEPIPCEITLTRTTHRNRYFGLGYVYDLRNIKDMEQHILHLESEVDKIYYDALTGIYNRRYFDETMQRILKTLSRSGAALSLLMVDIDNFKKYNDTYGHSEGDACLTTVAATLAKNITRTDDFVARYGGEEFVVVLPYVDERGAHVIADRLLAAVRSCNIPHEKNPPEMRVTISIGGTTGNARHTQDGGEYVRQADAMLYTSKQNGRNRYTFASLCFNQQSDPSAD